MNIYLIPTMGSFHLRYPNYNTVSVSDLLSHYSPEAIALASLTNKEYNSPRWQDTEEIVLPLSVIPWAKKNNRKIHFVKEPSPDPSAYQDFRRYAQSYPELQNKLYQCEVVLRPLEELLAQTLTVERIIAEVVPILYENQRLEQELLEEGPATNWRLERNQKMAQRILAIAAKSLAVLVEIEDYAFLKQELEKKANIIEAKNIEASPKARERSLLDFAFRIDVANPEGLIENLEKIASAEASYHIANILLHNGYIDDALAKLVKASKGDFGQPYYLPGYLLARLGQLYDLKANRNMAKKSYRGVLALDYAPKEALETARKGLETAFIASQAKI